MSAFSHYKSFPFPCLPLSFCQIQVMVALCSSKLWINNFFCFCLLFFFFLIWVDFVFFWAFLEKWSALLILGPQPLKRGRTYRISWCLAVHGLSSLYQHGSQHQVCDLLSLCWALQLFSRYLQYCNRRDWNKDCLTSWVKKKKKKEWRYWFVQSEVSTILSSLTSQWYLTQISPIPFEPLISLQWIVPFSICLYISTMKTFWASLGKDNNIPR